MEIVINHAISQLAPTSAGTGAGMANSYRLDIHTFVAAGVRIGGFRGQYSSSMSPLTAILAFTTRRIVEKMGTDDSQDVDWSIHLPLDVGDGHGVKEEKRLIGGPCVVAVY